MTQGDAEAALAEAGLELGAVTTEFSNEVDPGLVIRQDPEADAQVERGTNVAIVVSGGPSPTPTPTATVVQVPNVYGMDVGMASDTLEAAGFAVEVDERGSSQPAGTVIGMEPEAETLQPFGMTITITVAR
jgi:serine/threonine-protein kinase